MSSSHHHDRSLCRRGLAVCLVWIVSLTLWQTSAEATCGDYLMSHGDMHPPAATSQQPRDRLAGLPSPVFPRGCPNGECRSQDDAPEPVGSNSDNRIVDDVRSFGWLNGSKSQNRDSAGGQTRPADEPLPESPFKAELERPPQFPSV